MAQKIQSHLADSQFSLKSLASDLGFSPTYLSSLIKKELGLPFRIIWCENVSNKPSSCF